MSSDPIKETVWAFLFAIDRKDERQARREAVKLSSMEFTRKQKAFAEWLKDHGPRHPTAANWVKEQQRRREEQKAENERPLTVSYGKLSDGAMMMGRGFFDGT
jgi:hypothetical protein